MNDREKAEWTHIRGSVSNLIEKYHTARTRAAKELIGRYIAYMYTHCKDIVEDIITPSVVVALMIDGFFDVSV